jgi:hypothetical protein
MPLNLAEILKKTTELKTRVEKVEWLQKNDSQALRNILVLMYGKGRFEFLIPQTRPPFTLSEAHDNHAAWLRESRKLKYLVKGFGFDELNQIKRESVFIEMLENVHKDDAEIFVKMLKQETMKGITVRAINEAYGDIIPHDPNKKTDDEDE